MAQTSYDIQTDVKDEYMNIKLLLLEIRADYADSIHAVKENLKDRTARRNRRMLRMRATALNAFDNSDYKTCHDRKNKISS